MDQGMVGQPVYAALGVMDHYVGHDHRYLPVGEAHDDGSQMRGQRAGGFAAIPSNDEDLREERERLIIRSLEFEGESSYLETTSPNAAWERQPSLDSMSSAAWSLTN